MTSDDPVACWMDAYTRVRDLVLDLDDAALARVVPACPGWTAHELLCHVVGLGADVLDGDEPDDHNEGWTAAQVDARRDRPTRDVLAEWADVAARLPAWMREHGSRPLGDVVIHEQDLRGAVGAPGARDSGGLVLVRGWMADRLGATLADTDLPPLVMESTDDTWSWASAPGDPGVVLRAPGFDLFRAVTSRRTAAQLRGWTTSGDVAPYLDAFAGLGPLPDQPLPE